MQVYSKQLIQVAEQFLPPNRIPKGVFNVYELSKGVYSGQVWIKTVRRDLKYGDWVIYNHAGKAASICPNSDFTEWYNLVEPIK